MDKAQKTLIQTYFRKRAIANAECVGEEWYMGEGCYQLYEIKYCLENSIDINLKGLKSGHLKELLIQYPHLIDYDYLKDEEVDKINTEDTLGVLRAHPKLWKNERLVPYFTKARIISLYPEYLGITIRANEFSGSEIAQILTKQPQLVDRFDLRKLDGDNDNTHILAWQPDLVEKIDISGISDFHADGLANMQPKLRPYFKELKPYLFGQNN